MRKIIRVYVLRSHISDKSLGRTLELYWNFPPNFWTKRAGFFCFVANIVF